MTDHPEQDQGASEHTSLTPPIPPSPDRDAGGQHNGYVNGPPNKEDILHKLGQMPGLIAIGVLPPAKANAMKGVYQSNTGIVSMVFSASSTQHLIGGCKPLNVPTAN